MAKVWRELGYYDAETTSYSACAGLSGSGVSPFVSDFTGRLVGIRLVLGISAATSLGTNQVFRLTCSTWTPNMIEIAASGNGLATAPATPRQIFDYEVDQPVQAGVPISVEGKCQTAGSPVSVETLIMGQFEVGGR
jgi:hypothetical protein